MRISTKDWFKSGTPWVWLNAGAVSISVIMVVGLLGLIAVRGLDHFWPASVIEADLLSQDGSRRVIAGELVQTENVSAAQLISSGVDLPDDVEFAKRYLLKVGNRDVTGSDFAWALDRTMENQRYPENIMVFERREWGNFYGYLEAVKKNGEVIASGDEAGPTAC